MFLLTDISTKERLKITLSVMAKAELKPARVFLVSTSFHSTALRSGAPFVWLLWYVVRSTRVRRFSLVGREDFHGSSDALLAAHYTGYGVWMEEVYNFMN